MSALYWARIIRRVRGQSKPEYSSLEALVEAEADLPSDDFRIAAWVVGPMIAILGSAPCIFFGVTSNRFALWGVALACLIGGGLWFLFDRMDRAIPRSRARLRKLSKEIGKRMMSFSSIIGLDPALSPAVASMLDEAAGLYLKHSGSGPKSQKTVFTESHRRAAAALEEAMAKMLELGLPENARAQEVEVAKGWAMPLLDEMRALDRALDEHSRRLGSAGDTPLASLREARLELQGLGRAVNELEQDELRH